MRLLAAPISFCVSYLSIGARMGILSRLQLQTFRNYDSLDLPLSSGLNLFVGRNGQGKSNILEAVSYLGLLRSFRGSQPSALCQWGAGCFSVGATLTPTATIPVSTQLYAHCGERRILKLDQNPVQKASDFINQFICVCLAPEDIDLVKGAARGRRRFLDVALSQSDPSYLYQLQCYVRCLKSRNAMLRMPDKYPTAAIAAYDEELMLHGAYVEWQRHLFLSHLGEELKITGALLTDNGPELSVRFASSIVGTSSGWQSEKAVREAFRDVLRKACDRDRREGHTTVGCHRSDFACMFDGRSLARYGSEGECRMMSIALRVASMNVIRTSSLAERGVVLLVDDVTGELDPVRRDAFYRMISCADQVLLTTTNLDSYLKDSPAQLYCVLEGNVSSHE